MKYNEKLLELQMVHTNISNLNVVISKNCKLKNLRNLKSKFEEYKIKYITLNKELKKIQQEKESCTADLEVDSTELKELEFELYNESGSDLKLIENRESKISSLKVINEKKEEALLVLMEEETRLNNEITEIKKLVEDIKKNYFKTKKTILKEIEMAKKEIVRANKAKDKIEKELPSDILDLFNNLIEVKKVAVVILKNRTCSGCKMAVSSMTYDDFIKKQEMVFCDNCGRIVAGSEE
ncbi:MAG: zinc ribbon domain-containing protein [Clostridiaceae bacterium]